MLDSTSSLLKQQLEQKTEALNKAEQVIRKLGGELEVAKKERMNDQRQLTVLKDEYKHMQLTYQN